MTSKTDTLDIGKPAASPDARQAGLVTLYVPDPSAVPSAWVLGDRPLVLGREPPPGGLALPFGSVSRNHARLARKGDAIVLDDLDSRNGTFLNGTKIRFSEVSHGDEIRVGEAVFRVDEQDASRYAEFPLAGKALAPGVNTLVGGFAMEAIRRDVGRLASADLPVLVLGESGTGKELVVRALHGLGGRPGPLVTVNCAALPEAELGADVVRGANGGTLFLDEIGDLPEGAQAKLLRLLETEAADVRLACATQRPLLRMVREARFRPDLFARIGGHVIELAPLRERKEDILQLVRLFLERERASQLRVTPAFMVGLVSYDWPLNVRELETAIKRAVVLADNGALDEPQLPSLALAALREARTREGTEAPAKRTRSNAPPEEELRAMLTKYAGNVAAVARALGKDRAQIHRWLKLLGLSLDEFRP